MRPLTAGETFVVRARATAPDTGRLLDDGTLTVELTDPDGHERPADWTWRWDPVSRHFLTTISAAGLAAGTWRAALNFDDGGHAGGTEIEFRVKP